MNPLDGALWYWAEYHNERFKRFEMAIAAFRALKSLRW